MRSRIAIAAVLATGLIMTGGSAGLALSGTSGSENAGKAQYFIDTTGTAPTPPPKGSEGAQGEETRGELGEAGPGGGSPDDVQVARQTGSGGGGDKRLPFTGLAAIPLLLLGAGLTITGLVLRRRLPGSPD